MANTQHVDKILLSHIRKSALPLLAVLVLMILVVCFDVIAPWPFKILIDNVLSGETFASHSWLNWLHQLFPSRDLLGFFAVFVYFSSTFALASVEYLKAVFTKRVIRTITTDFSKAAFKNLETLAIGFYSKQKIGDYIYRLGYDVAAIGELLEEGVLPIITSTLYLGITVTIMFLINIPLTLLSLTALPFLVLGLYSFNSRITQATKRSEFFNSVTFSFIEEALSHLKIIQAFSQEKRESEAFDRRVDTSLWSDVIMYRLDFLLSLLVGIIIAISYSVVMLFGIRAVFAGTLTTGLLIVFIFYLDNLTNPILSFIYATTYFRQALTKLRRMNDFFDTKKHLDPSLGAVKALTGSDIVFDRVSVIISNKHILRNVSFTIEAGKRTVIFGTSGSGKTTISNLIMRFIDKPTHGRVLLGGTSVEEYELKVVRDSIAYVPQEITLFNDTVRNNIVFGNKHHSWDAIHRAAALSAADDFITKLPGKYSFHVGEGGGFLSGGQRQRLMLARAFMKAESPILLFDETFSALDVKTRKEVLHNLHAYSKGKTTIIISNIFDVIDAADNIIVLSRGELLYSGPASRLPKEISLYKMIAQNEPDAQEVV